MKQIGDCAYVHQMKEFENLSTGIPCDPEVVQATLWVLKNNDILSNFAKNR